MNKNIQILVKMQSCDDEISKRRILMKKLPEQLNNLKVNLSDAQAVLQQVKDALENNKVEQNRRELTIKSNKDQIGKYQNQLLTIETNKEYKALNKEVSHLEQLNTNLEDEIVTYMEDAEELKDDKKEAESGLKKAESELQANEKKLEAEILEVEKEIEDFKNKRRELAKEVPIALVKKYAALIKNRNSKAVVYNVGEACGGCGYKIRPQLLVDLHEGEKIIFCESCSRILVYDREEN